MKSLFIPYLFSDGAVLQRDCEIEFWGYAPIDSAVRLRMGTLTLQTISDKQNGFFKFLIPAHSAGGPVDLIVSCQDIQRKISGILFGDVWLLSGQSNMQLWMKRLEAKYPNAIADANEPNIRFFIVPQRYNFEQPESELDGGNWVSAVGSQIEQLSGIGYFFARQVQEEEHVPVGLISTAVGGTPIRAWLSETTLSNINELPVDFGKLRDHQFIDHEVHEDEDYQSQYAQMSDEADVGLQERWDSTKLDDSKWDNLPLGELWPEKYQLPGIVWIRKSIRVPKKIIGKSAEIRLGTFIDADETFINGVKVGETGYQYPPRNYHITKLPKVITIAIRLHVFQGPGGPRFGKQHLLVCEGEQYNLDAGTSLWKVRRSCWLPPKRDGVFPQYLPVGLYNGMIFPIRRYQFRGILWYQGESDTDRPENYGKVFIHLIQEWRRMFKQPELPFLFVQLPNCAIEPGHVWSKVRVQQRMGLLMDKTAMIVSLGLGEDNDLHPLNKSAIASELFDSITAVHNYPHGYCNGPLASKAYLNHRQIIVRFNLFGKKLVADPGAFELIEDGRIYSLDNFVVQNDCIVIALPENCGYSNNMKIRYAWHNAPNVFIKNDLGKPATPFVLRVGKNFYQDNALSKM